MKFLLLFAFLVLTSALSPISEELSVEDNEIEIHSFNKCRLDQYFDITTARCLECTPCKRSEFIVTYCSKFEDHICSTCDSDNYKDTPAYRMNCERPWLGRSRSIFRLPDGMKFGLPDKDTPFKLTSNDHLSMLDEDDSNEILHKFNFPAQNSKKMNVIEDSDEDDDNNEDDGNRLSIFKNNDDDDEDEDILHKFPSFAQDSNKINAVETSDDDDDSLLPDNTGKVNIVKITQNIEIYYLKNPRISDSSSDEDDGSSSDSDDSSEEVRHLKSVPHFSTLREKETANVMGQYSRMVLFFAIVGLHMLAACLFACCWWRRQAYRHKVVTIRHIPEMSSEDSSVLVKAVGFLEDKYRHNGKYQRLVGEDV
ncbi:hypothetical protein FO519_000917 [Halicephalobus sp. NKZ332]|nr:hypothetical protein FO519_000917 [Halicephalobus sp. NKZ332]